LANFQSTGGLNVSLKEIFETTLPQGPVYDDYKMQMYVKVIDDTGGVTIFNINETITVHPDNNKTNEILNSILYGDFNSTENRNLFSGDLRHVSSLIISLSAVLNSESFGNKSQLNESIPFVTTSGPERNIDFALNFESLAKGSINPKYSKYVNIYNGSLIKNYNYNLLISAIIGNFKYQCI
jgi:hypothetical protein